ncbi:unnamed protein product [Chrysodeixis includens]|uniref:Uncharacterized protein n=1 Tax=Chrysodeixis includens TaxID=689277 RepID=A0A9P0FRF7_CHRIL|nr:unnamed protein product [Chrysodeixis includens]
MCTYRHHPKDLHLPTFKSPDRHGTVRKISEENQSLREQLREATDKQHQEMSRAIDLKEKNEYLRSKIHEAKIEAFNLRHLNNKLKENKL